MTLKERSNRVYKEQGLRQERYIKMKEILENPPHVTLYTHTIPQPKNRIRPNKVESKQ